MPDVSCGAKGSAGPDLASEAFIEVVPEGVNVERAIRSQQVIDRDPRARIETGFYPYHCCLETIQRTAHRSVSCRSAQVRCSDLAKWPDSKIRHLASLE